MSIATRLFRSNSFINYFLECLALKRISLKKVTGASCRSIPLFILPILLFLAIATRSVDAAPSESDIIKGTADFVADRAELEAMNWLINEIGATICRERGKGYFRNFCIARTQFVYAYSASISSIIEALRKDMEELPGRISEDEAVSVFLETINQVQNGMTPENILKNLSNNLTIQNACKSGTIGKFETACAFYLTGLLGALQGEKSNSQNVIITAPNTTITFSYLIDTISNNNEFKTREERNKTKIDMINKRIKYAMERNNPDIYEILNASSELGTMILEDAEFVVTFFPFSSSDNEKKKEIELLQKNIGLTKHLLKAAVAMNSKKYAEGLVELQWYMEITEDEDKKWSNLMLYLPLLIDLASLNSREEVKIYIGTNASPLGMWRMKRNKSMISLGSLVGFSAGQEYLLDGKSFDNIYRIGTNMDKPMSGSIFAPIGFDFSWPLKSSNSTMGFFISIFDLGHLVESRYSTDEEGAEVESQVSFDKVRSPGVFVRFGVKRTPWVFGFGASEIPKIKRTLLGSNAEKIEHAYRASLFLSMDVVIFPLKTW